MKKTDYTIEPLSGTTIVEIYKSGKLIASSALGVDSALQKIWIDEGSVFDDFYVSTSDGEVFCQDRGTI